ncbi:MAG: TlpA family protein disulfide reductase [Saprospiraceae bacterium]|nr:TlpA family protein disulfide reductase [Saprospiraceae bacterium]
MKKFGFNTFSLILLLVVAGVFLGRYFYFQPKFINGEKAPGFEATLINGNPMSLSDLQGNWVLIDFWGSWCPPCRAENPALAALYRDFNGKSFKSAENFEIVSVGIERDEKRWKQAIQRDQLQWPYHVMDTTTSFKFFDGNISSQYGITQVPTKYLLNANGLIVKVDPKPEELKELLENDLR